MKRYVVDTSAIMMVLKQEPKFERVFPLLADSCASTLNAAECIAILMREGSTEARASLALETSLVKFISFDLELARTAGALIVQTRHAGLSLGDRACLALAIRENLPVYTADRNWKNVNVGVDVNLVL